MSDLHLKETNLKINLLKRKEQIKQRQNQAKIVVSLENEVSDLNDSEEKNNPLLHKNN